ncbi:type III secretion system cytoplasmic ring protein SctQ [Brenneria rubrifaciens]|uniref:YscQ/HrcQ family type III secretion apparatus protein n=1 Tax=Brenneria rubrifaciens TaxID=55213 RepID=A0A4P8QT10_9GAMM|nr:type III secretion system cytoplasmic ring protein SctQ [Brenneria rubrifaciens]QCR08530.1 YscQ/HrcQ family type III secretion apparatus protein [Brenneria rubrifaciens]
MTIRPLTLTSMRAGQASVRQQLATGVTLPFSRDRQVGTVRLHLAKERQVETLSDWRCDHGAFALADPSPVLSLLADCPLVPVNDANSPPDAWYWTLYNQLLSPSIHALLGEIHPGIAPGEYQDTVTAWLTVSWGGIRARSLMVAPASTWLALLSISGWRNDYIAIPPSFTVTAPLILADMALTPEALRRLRPGDLILPNQPYFLPSGQGTLVLPPWYLHGTLQLNGVAPYQFTVTDMESAPVNTAFDDPAPENYADITDDDITGTPSDNASPLPPLPLALHVRCGNVTLTLPTLQRLAPGAVLTLSHIVPGEAWLYHGDLPLAQGELVDVEGKLGLQITRRLSGLDSAAAMQESGQ